MNNKIVIAVVLALLALAFCAGISSAKVIAENALVDFTSGIVFDTPRAGQPATFVAGERVSVKVSTSRLKDCGDCVVSWKSDSPDVIFQDIVQKPYSQEATMIISSNIVAGKNILVSVEAVHNGWTRSVNSSVRIVTNTPPLADVAHPKSGPSYSPFEVDCSNSKTGSGFNEAYDRIWRCRVTVIDEDGKIIPPSPRITTSKPGEIISPVRVKTGAKGVDKIVVEVEDTFGAVSIYNGLINVDMGSTGKDFPVIYVSDKIPCHRGETCIIDASKTIEMDGNVSGFSYWLMDNGTEVAMLKDSKGIDCLASVCKTVFNKTGKFPVKVKGHYFGQKKFGYKITNMMIYPSLSDSQTVAPGQNRSSYPPINPQAAADKGPAKSTQDTGISFLGIVKILFALVLIVLMIIVLKKLRKKKQN